VGLQFPFIWLKNASGDFSNETETSLVAALVLSASTGLSQKAPEKPSCTPIFTSAGIRLSRCSDHNGQEDARLLLVGFHQNWDLEKIAKESKVPEENLDKLFADLEEGRPQSKSISIRGVRRCRYSGSISPKFKQTWKPIQEYTKLVRANWAEIESAAASFAGAKGVPKEQLLYEIVVGGILFGGMNDAFFQDQTIMVPPPRRVGSQRYYGWLVESDPKLAGVLKREQWESDGYTLVSIGPDLPQNRTSLDRIRMNNGMVLDEAEARRFGFIAILTKDKLLPYFAEPVTLPGRIEPVGRQPVRQRFGGLRLVL
jgi:hypothetical protein